MGVSGTVAQPTSLPQEATVVSGFKKSPQTKREIERSLEPFDQKAGEYLDSGSMTWTGKILIKLRFAYADS
jgi:hypothetical protein